MEIVSEQLGVLRVDSNIPSSSGMDRWVGKVALVTGASAGIGKCISTNLVKAGMVVIGCGRNLQALQVSINLNPCPIQQTFNSSINSRESKTLALNVLRESFIHTNATLATVHKWRKCLPGLNQPLVKVLMS